MDRQHLMKMAMLALAMVALVYIASVCSRKNKVEKFKKMRYSFVGKFYVGNPLLPLLRQSSRNK